jgi:hypothetical protein
MTLSLASRLPLLCALLGLLLVRVQGEGSSQFQGVRDIPAFNKFMPAMARIDEIAGGATGMASMDAMLKDSVRRNGRGMICARI